MAVATAKVPQVIAPTGIVPTAFTPAQVEGHYFANNGSTFLLVANGSGAPVDVTAISQLTVEGLAVADSVVEVGAGVTKLLGPFNPSIFNDENGNMTVTFEAVTSVTCSIISLGI